MKTLNASTILNLGSLATFIAFPLLYTAAGGDNVPALWGGLALLAGGIAAPFAAWKICRKPS